MKRVFRIIAIGVAFGLAMVALQKGLQMDTDDFMRVYWAAAVGIVFAAVVVNLLYSVYYQRKRQKAVRLLEAGETREYITEVKKLLQTAKGQNLRSVLALDLAAGYMAAKEFHLAIPVLEELSAKRLTGSGVKAVHRINLCMCYFYTERSDEALALYDESRQLFDRYRNGRQYGANLAILDVFAAVWRKQYRQAEALLQKAGAAYDAPRFQSAFRDLAGILEKAEGSLPETP